MGYYTRFHFKCVLKEDTPNEVINLLERVVTKGDLGTEKTFIDFDDVFKPAIKHKFFDCSRWYMLFLCNNFDKELQSVFDKETKTLLINSDFKNYGNEIEHFLNWITPFLYEVFEGWYQGETDIYKTSFMTNT